MTDELLNLIKLMNQKPIAFNRHYVDVGCGINGSLMLSQLVYWSDKSKDPEGWIYKTGVEWTEETGLTRYEQEGARKKLKELGFISEMKKGVPCKIYFKVNKSVLYGKLLQFAENQQTRLQETTNPVCGKPANKDAENHQTITENTAENTAENTTDILNTPENEIFEYWKTVFKKNAATKFEGVRKRKVKARLSEGYTVEQIKLAIDHCSQSSYHVENGFTDLELICRDQVKLDRFIQVNPALVQQKAKRGTDDFHASFYGDDQGNMRDVGGSFVELGFNEDKRF